MENGFSILKKTYTLHTESVSKKRENDSMEH